MRDPDLTRWPLLSRVRQKPAPHVGAVRGTALPETKDTGRSSAVSATLGVCGGIVA